MDIKDTKEYKKALEIITRHNKMKTIEQEAEEYGNSFDYNESTIQEQLAAEYGFIAGHNSKATQAKILQAQIDVLSELRYCKSGLIYSTVLNKIDFLYQQLKELE